MIYIIISLLFLRTGHGFPTDALTGWTNVYTKSHRDISIGVHQAVATFLEENDYIKNGTASVGPVSTINNIFWKWQVPSEDDFPKTK